MSTRWAPMTADQKAFTYTDNSNNNSKKNKKRKHNAITPTYYAVFRGRRTGVFSSWADVAPLVDGYAGAQFKKFQIWQDAVCYAASGRTDAQTYNYQGAIDTSVVGPTETAVHMTHVRDLVIETARAARPTTSSMPAAYRAHAGHSHGETLVFSAASSRYPSSTPPPQEQNTNISNNDQSPHEHDQNGGTPGEICRTVRSSHFSVAIPGNNDTWDHGSSSSNSNFTPKPHDMKKPSPSGVNHWHMQQTQQQPCYCILTKTRIVRPNTRTCRIESYIALCTRAVLPHHPNDDDNGSGHAHGRHLQQQQQQHSFHVTAAAEPIGHAPPCLSTIHRVCVYNVTADSVEHLAATTTNSTVPCKEADIVLRAELSALVAAYEYVRSHTNKSNIKIYTTHLHAYNCITRYMTAWSNTGWLTSRGAKVPHADLLDRLRHLRAAHHTADHMSHDAAVRPSVSPSQPTTEICTQTPVVPLPPPLRPPPPPHQKENLKYVPVSGSAAMSTVDWLNRLLSQVDECLRQSTIMPVSVGPLCLAPATCALSAVATSKYHSSQS